MYMSTGITLHVTFTGLCLFVRSKNQKQMNVLAPITHAGAHLHLIRLEAGGLFLPMDGYGLDLTNLIKGGDIDLHLAAEVVNISELVGGAVDLDKVEGDASGAPNKLAGRVNLNNGEMTGCEGLGRWKIKNKDGKEVHLHLANFVHWTIPDIPGGNVALKRWVLGKDHTKPEPFAVLRPDENREIFVTYHCLPPKEYDHVGSPTIPGPDDPAKHFDHFYDLIEQAPARRLPTFDKTSWPYKPKRKKLVDKRNFDSLFDPFDATAAAGKTYNCMPASADPA
jgi:hypothetical protein